MTNILSKQFKHRGSFLRGTFFTTSVLAAGLLSSLAPSAFAQYTVTNLVSNQNPIGANPADPALVNAWGITSFTRDPDATDGTAGSPGWRRLIVDDGSIAVRLDNDAMMRCRRTTTTEASTIAFA